MRNSVAAGWLGFWEMRVTPTGDYREPRHGNTIHGSYSKAGRRSVHLARVMIAISRRLDGHPRGRLCRRGFRAGAIILRYGTRLQTLHLEPRTQADRQFLPIYP